jgi:hypothetical protein
VNETELSHIFFKSPLLTPAVYRKLHGNIYQDGLPDHLLVLPSGTTVLIETKVVHQQKPRFDQIFNLLRPSQKQFMCTARSPFIFLLGFHHSGLVFLCSTMNFPRLLGTISTAPAALIPISQAAQVISAL